MVGVAVGGAVPALLIQGGSRKNFARVPPCDQGSQRRENARIWHWAGGRSRELVGALARRVSALGSVNVGAEGGLRKNFARVLSF